jgi:hypothetical protein
MLSSQTNTIDYYIYMNSGGMYIDIITSLTKLRSLKKLNNIY